MINSNFRILALAACLAALTSTVPSQGSKSPSKTNTKTAAAKPTPAKTLDDLCKAATANYNTLLKAYQAAVPKDTKPAEYAKTKKLGDYLSVLDKATNDFYTAAKKDSKDLHLAIALSTANTDLTGAQSNLAKELKAHPNKEYQKDAQDALNLIKANDKETTAVLKSTSEFGVAVAKAPIDAALKAGDPDDIQKLKDETNFDTALGASQLSAFLVDWTKKSAGYDGALKTGAGDEDALEKRFLYKDAWPTDAGGTLKVALANPNAYGDQARRLLGILAQLNHRVFKMTYDAGQIAGHIDETATVQGARIKGVIDAYRSIVPVHEKCTDSKALPLVFLKGRLTYLQGDSDLCQNMLDKITARLSKLDVTTTSQMVRLYYFTNVPEVVRALDPLAKEMNDDFFKEVDTAEQENALTTATGNHLKAVAEEAEKLSILRKADTELRKQQAIVDQKQAKVDKLQAQADAFGERLTPGQRMDAAISAQVAYIDSLKARKTELEVDKETNKDEIARLQSEIEKENKTLLAMRKRKANNAVSEAELQHEITNSNTELTTATTALSTAQGTFNTAKTNYDTAVTNLNTAQSGQLTAALTMGLAARNELRAFRNQLRRQPYWESLPDRSSPDPVKRCYIMGFENANELYVRGLPDDVHYVRELVGQFDVPAPQARVTLYNLQLNSSDAKEATEAVARIQSELNGLRGNMLLIQDVLRNVIVREVHRVERVNKSVFSSNRLEDVDWRYKFYPSAIRKELGVKDFKYEPETKVVGLPEILKKSDNQVPLPVLVGSIYDDFQRASEKLDQSFQAVKEQKAYETAKETATKTKPAEATKFDAVIGREKAAKIFHVTEAGWLAMRGLDNWEKAEQKYAEAFGAMVLDPATKQKIAKAYMDLIEDQKFIKAYSEKVTELIRSDGDDKELNNLLREEYPLVADETKKPGDDKDKGKTQVTKPGDTKAGAQGQEQEPEQEPKVVTIRQHVNRVLKSFAAIKKECECNLKPDEDSLAVGRFTLPDPLKCTTLGEMLMIVSLGTQESRTRILHDFADDLFNTVKVAETQKTKMPPAGGSKSKPGDSEETSDLLQFASAINAMFGSTANPQLELEKTSVGDSTLFPYFPRAIFGGLEPKVDPSALDSMNSNQAEIVSALKVRGQRNCIDFVLNQLEARGVNTRSSRSERLPIYRGSDLKPLVDWSIGAKQKRNSQQAYPTTVDQLIAYRPSASEATPRLAAANDMIKRFMSGLEADLEHFIVEKALGRIREKTVGPRIQFGSFQKQSIITTNRLVARLDTSAVATVGTQVDQEALQLGQQLAAIISASDPKNQPRRPGQTAGQFITDVTNSLIPAAGTVAALTNKAPRNQPNLSSIFSALLTGGIAKALTETPPDPEVYTVGSGGTFKLTPVFDPTGQALHFVFDYYNEVPIQGIGTSSSSDVPRVTRQSIVTQIALSNLEFGQVASFEATTKAGRDSKQKTPIIGSFFPDIPILGYLWKTKGSAVRQYTVVFAQTTMYPTISDIMGLLVDKNAEPYYSAPRRRN